MAERAFMATPAARGEWAGGRPHDEPRRHGKDGRANPKAVVRRYWGAKGKAVAGGWPLPIGSVKQGADHVRARPQPRRRVGWGVALSAS